MDNRDDLDKRGLQLSLSVIIPTLNSGQVLEGCLKSIACQDYSGSVEIVIADGGSTDNTLQIAGRYGCRIISNRLQTGEAGKSSGIRESSGELIALIDSDNILPDCDWFSRMTEPFSNPDITGSEPIEYVYRRSDETLTRYSALLGMNDPLCHFLGNYDRLNRLSGKWTNLDVNTEDRGNYLEVTLKKEAVPTIGANGFLVRRAMLEVVDFSEYLFDTDITQQLVEFGYHKFAKVKTGIIHLYGKGISDFCRKQLRRIRDYRYYHSLEMRSYPWDRKKKLGMLKFCLYTVLVFPLLFQSIIGYFKVHDRAWFFHVPACICTLFIYGWGFLESIFRPREQERIGWHQ